MDFLLCTVLQPSFSDWFPVHHLFVHVHNALKKESKGEINFFKPISNIILPDSSQIHVVDRPDNHAININADTPKSTMNTHGSRDNSRRCLGQVSSLKQQLDVRRHEQLVSVRQIEGL